VKDFRADYEQATGKDAHGFLKKVHNQAPGAAQVSHPNNTSNETTTVGETMTASNSSVDQDIAQLKEDHKQVMKEVTKLLKENKDLKKRNEMLARKELIVKSEQNVNPATAAAAAATTKTTIGSGSHDKPIELEDSDDEEEEEVTDSSQKFGKEEYNEMKRKYEKVVSELEKSKCEKNQKEDELVTAKNVCSALERQIEAAKIEVNADYERRLHDIHESWKEQGTQIDEQQQTIESLKSGQGKEITEKQQAIDNLNSQLEELKRRYQDMTDALMRSTKVVEEERMSRKELINDYLAEKMAHKRTKKEFKAFKSLHANNVKAEDNYDV